MRFKIFLSLLVVLQFSCSSERDENYLFTLMKSSHTGIQFSNDLNETEEFNMVEYLYFNNGGGVSTGDINNDGLIDIYFSANQISNKLYLNKGNMIFEEITSTAGVQGLGDWATGTTMADVNGDGYLDIYVCYLSDYKGKKGKNQLFINNGDLTFTDMAEEYGLDFAGFSTQAAFFDFDLDGDLDMYLLNHSIHSTRNYGPSTLRMEYDLKAGDRLYQNEINSGRAYFSDITGNAGIYSSSIGYGLAVGIGDVNNDGYPDIYISNDFHENDYMYINQKDGTFSEKFIDMMAHSSRSSMGNDIADINNDGLQDVLVLDMLPEKEEIRQRSGGEDSYDVYNIKRNYGYSHQFVRNTMQLNLGNSQFAEIGRLAGIFATDWSWSPLVCDMDNDGFKDIYITNGIFRRANDLDYVSFLTNDSRMRRGANLSDLPNHSLYEKMPLDPLENYIYKNNGDLTFTNMVKQWGMNMESYSNGSSYADFDNDGDLDLIVNNINANAFIYRNNTDQYSDNRYLKVRFQGASGNYFGIGTRVSLYIDDAIYLGENYSTRGFLSSVPPELHFGLGEVLNIDSVDISWPGGNLQRLYDVSSNQILIVNYQNSSPIDDIQIDEIEKISIFSEAGEIPGLNFKHNENKFQDYLKEPLIPHNLSSEGPAMAVGDINGDGMDDIFLGGSRGQRSELLVQLKNGFRKTNIDLFRQDYAFEDVDAAFFDADNDNDLDLFVVSGGNEKLLPDEIMSDRLYVNDGNGNFTKSEDRLPDFSHNGSCIEISDYDLDGDLDMFLGSRSLPGAYGLSPESFILENDGKGKFTITGEAFGMVTDGTWCDIDGDNYPELIIVGEWMPITIIKNHNGVLELAPETLTIDESSGWWFSIDASDIDNDGDIDFIAGNLGLNSIMKTNPEDKVKMYINDFDNDGSIEQVITVNKEGKNYPLASMDELAGSISFIKDKYNSYADFAGSTLQELFPENLLDKAIVKEVETFESLVFLNDGDGFFKRIKLPVEIQFSPVMDMLFDDFDKDGIIDMVLGGNFNSVKPSIGRYDAGYGWYLKGKGNGYFTVIYPNYSGFNVTGEIRKIHNIKIMDNDYLLVGINDKEIVTFELNSK